jgi:SAM-dependent methyltransferase
MEGQTAYWDKVAHSKTFTHPLDKVIMERLDRSVRILDYGCGYGRLAQEFYENGFNNVLGVDTSDEMIKRGLANYPHLDLRHIGHASEINIEQESLDLVLLSVVLTCIPSNKDQTELLRILHGYLKKGGILFISDMYVQADRIASGTYSSPDGDELNYGVFTLPEGVTLRHHTKEWIKELLGDFSIATERTIPVKTMNGNQADAFQIIAVK